MTARRTSRASRRRLAAALTGLAALWLTAAAGCEPPQFSSSAARPRGAAEVAAVDASGRPAAPAGESASASLPTEPAAGGDGAASAEPVTAGKGAPAAAPSAEPARVAAVDRRFVAEGREPAPAPRQRILPVRQGAVQEISFDDIKLEIGRDDRYEPAHATPRLKELTGQRVRIRGYMLPSFQQSGIKQFVLVRDNMECCFGPGAALYDCIVVDMAADKTAEFSHRPISVEGTFSIHEWENPDEPDGKQLAIYHLDGEQVR